MTIRWLGKSAIVREAYTVGDWVELIAVLHTPGQPDTELRLGTVKDGTLKTRTRYATHLDSNNERQIDFSCILAQGMEFTGRAEEIHRENLLFLLDRRIDEAAWTPPEGGGAGAIPLHFETLPMQFFTLRGHRAVGFAAQDGDYNQDNPVMEFCLWKCRNADLVSLGSEDAVIGTPVRFVALSDSGGKFGGDPSAPYGWVNVGQNGPAPSEEEPPTEPPAGESLYIGGGSIYSWDGKTMTLVVAVENQSHYSVSMVGDTGFACGFDYNTYLATFAQKDGTEWNELLLPVDQGVGIWYSTHALGDDSAFVCGQGELFHWDGDWSANLCADPNFNLCGIWGLEKTAGMVCCGTSWSDGSGIVLAGGTAGFSVIQSESQVNFFCVWGTGADNWFVGGLKFQPM